MSKKIIVTGGAGFIGSHLCRSLLNAGDSVICIDNLFTGNMRNIEELTENPNFTFVEHDIAVPIDLEADQIYNLASPASPVHYQREAIATWKTSTFGIFNMLELAVKNGNIPILQASTSEIYGDPLEHPQKEEYWGNVNPCGLRSCYDESKRAGETICFDFWRKHQTPIRVVRIFNTYGPNMSSNDGRVVSNFIVQALQNEPITLYGDGSQTRCFQYVDDLISALTSMMNNDRDFLGPVNLGSTNEFTMRELAELILELIPESKSNIVHKPLPADDPKQRKPDISLAKKQLDWEPQIALKEGLQKTIAYFSSVLQTV